MPPLRKCLKHPGAYLALLGLLVAGTCADSFRLPDRQLSARTYIALVHGYQSLGRPVVAGVVQCRFRPTCSGSSIEAVQKWRFRPAQHGSTPMVSTALIEVHFHLL